MKSKFLANISHELQRPSTSIIATAAKVLKAVLLGVPRRQRQPWILGMEPLAYRFLIFAKYGSIFGGLRYTLISSAALVYQSGSFEAMSHCRGCGLRSCLFQILAIVMCERSPPSRLEACARTSARNRRWACAWSSMPACVRRNVR